MITHITLHFQIKKPLAMSINRNQRRHPVIITIKLVKFKKLTIKTHTNKQHTNYTTHNMKNIIYNNQITKINGVETLNFKQHLTRSRRPIAAN